MAGLLSRIAARFTGRRRFDAAAGGRRWEGHRPSFGRVGPETLAAAPAIRSRARYYANNNGWCRNGVEAWTAALTGASFTAASTHPDAGVRELLGDYFADWSTRCDADGRTDAHGLLTAAARGLVLDGESFTHLLTTREGLRLRLLPPEQVDESKTAELSDGRHIIAGIEFNAAGEREACHVLRQRPTDLYGTSQPAVRVDAADVCHLMAPIGAGQVRGVSWLAPILLALSETDQLEDALLTAAKCQAMLMAFLVDQNGNAASDVFDGEKDGSTLLSGLEPGTMKRLPPGFDIRFSTPQQFGQSAEFAKHQLRHVAAGLGLPAFMVDGDMTAVNYSSARTALIGFRQRVEALQYNVLVPQLLRPIRNRVIVAGVLSGDLDLRDFESRQAEYLAAEFYPPAQEWVDPDKDAKGIERMLKNRLMSRRQAVARQGYSIESLDAEIAADSEREKRLGMTTPEPESPNAA
jgi:lambda family phage portal protein